MTKLSWDFLALETFDRLTGVVTFIEFADKAMPEMEGQGRAALKRRAQQENWDYQDYQVETDILEGEYRRSLPRHSAYASLVLLHSVVETQLFACAMRIGGDRASAFQVADVRGRGIDQPVLYLQRVTGVDAKRDPEWGTLHDVQMLRNIVVHRGGRRGTSVSHQREFDGLLQRHKPGLSSIECLFGKETELWLSLPLCLQFAKRMEGFFKRLLKSLGLPHEGVTTHE